MASTETPLAPLRRIDPAIAALGAIPLVLAALAPEAVGPVLGDMARSLVSTLPFLAFAVLAIGWLKATGADGAVARAFEGRETVMILAAALGGALSPFCSCEVIPLIAALLAAGVPLSAVMAFWLASPLMDPAMFALTAAALGPELALAKLGAAVLLAIGAGFATRALTATGALADPLRPGAAPSRCCGHGPSPTARAPVWRFWTEPDRRATFGEATRSNGLFLLKWLALAYLIEALMVRFVPAEAISSVLGGEGVGPVILAALIGAPAYLNGYAAPALVSGLVEAGMTPGAALSFLIAGGVTCIPAAVAVWALVRPGVFGLYLSFGAGGAVTAGLALNLLI